LWTLPQESRWTHLATKEMENVRRKADIKYRCDPPLTQERIGQAGYALSLNCVVFFSVAPDGCILRYQGR
jgi:hypothetical protein